ncbi:hypothetical protein [Bacillus coahuilensis]|uniref:hypothetical protein n=1 Tax=Bacillus coahuilensis TaxID=408580 RepID=UPI0001850EC9|nr:hypothetical protein [Bacillus coahuilensis]
MRNLQHDPSYKTSPHPVYKIDAFSSRASQNTKYPLLDFIVGYNMMDESFACLPIEQFKVKRSKIVHSKNGQNHEFYHSWKELDHFLRKHAVSQ